MSIEQISQKFDAVVHFHLTKQHFPSVEPDAECTKIEHLDF
jgi:hypothetical protein